FHRRGLSRSVWSQKTNDFAFLYCKIQGINGSLRAVYFCKILYCDGHITSVQDEKCKIKNVRLIRYGN
ncbi:MAG: hypothetical protein ACI9V1_003727, partial [Spirosomataceae bacterium]